MAWSDYIDFDIQYIADMYGEDAMQAVQEEVEGIFDEFQSAIDFADSKEEKALAEERLSDFIFTQDEAESIGEETERAFIADQMYGSDKSQALIDRWLELGGAISSGLMEMSSGGGGYSPPAPAPAPEPDYTKDYEDDEYDYDDYYYSWDDWTEDIVEAVSDFFENMFGGF
tara:strand:- start:511 stop:1023 length:513 start_codon:yes stop_codon:yes gene_type:complete